MSLSDSTRHPSAAEEVSLLVQKDDLDLPLPTHRTSSWPPSPDEDPGLPPFPLEEPGPRPMTPGSLPSPPLSLEEEEEVPCPSVCAGAEGLNFLRAGLAFITCHQLPAVGVITLLLCLL